MSPEDKLRLNEALSKVNEEFIYKHYNIDKERSGRELVEKKTDLLGEIVDQFSSQKTVPFEDLLDFLTGRFEVFSGDTPNCTLCIQIEEGDYDYPPRIDLVTKNFIPETNQQVFHRLIQKEKSKIRRDMKFQCERSLREAEEEKARKLKAEQEAKRIQDARDLLVNAGFQVSGLE